ncbi:hypothetical protein SARC_13717 [Sphaeroforma arctica JP610]|uniref:SET domain-containing protein n=1 Tax=Sphaeroforma arctica JP610 TaxID=667725 RepID=A0A0L0FAJ0_9EUKA|nr:hypothetical protein SARC_13717 [Sphaeroforma arctica JP610]KNC73727.1 hypothetical protein SARC_13717 [Sphaeroforma arctica JP610]|eukprot:XP_014147629.1 hypothetical protein SARC_13717 [Sphaeroforma arctica JP610]
MVRTGACNQLCRSQHDINTELVCSNATDGAMGVLFACTMRKIEVGEEILTGYKIVRTDGVAKVSYMMRIPEHVPPNRSCSSIVKAKNLSANGPNYPQRKRLSVSEHATFERC